MNKSLSFGPGRFGPWAAYGMAVLFTGATLAVRLAMDGTLEGQPTIVIFTVPIMLSAYLGGLRGGLLATFLSYLATSYYLLPPIHSFSVASGAERWQQFFIVLAGVVISSLSEALHRSRRLIDQANVLSRQADIVANRLVAIVGSSEDAIIGKDLNGVVTSWNSGAQKIFGYSAGEMEGEPILKLIPTDRQGEETAILDKIRRGERVEHFETRRRTKDGAIIDVSITASPIKDGEGRIVGVSKIARDVTLMRAREVEIRRVSRLYAALSQVNQAIVKMATREELFHKVCEVLVKFGGFRMAWVGWPDAATQRLMPVAQYGDEAGYLPNLRLYVDDRPEGMGPAGVSFRSGEPFICNDTQAEASLVPWSKELEKHRLLAFAVLPIRIAQEVAGTLIVYAKERGYFKDREVALLTEAASDISFALDNLAREQARLAAESARWESESRYRTLFQYAPDGIVIADKQSTYIDANASICQLLGYTREELIGMNASQIVTKAEIPHIESALNTISKEAKYYRQWEFRRKDGSTFPAEVIATVMPDGNILGMIRDITERKQSEETLRLREKALAEISQGVLISDESRLTTYANASFTAISGYPEIEILGRGCAILQGPDTDPATVQKMRTALNAGEAFEGEILNYRKDGTPFWNDLSIAPIHPADGGPIRFVGIQRDITERKQAQEALSGALDRLKLAIKAGRAGTWEYDLQTGEVDWDDQMLALYGKTQENVAAGTLRWEHGIHPEDLARTTAIYDGAIRSGQEAFETEFRIIRGDDGEERFIRGMGIIVRDDAGQPLRLTGINWDVTEERTREQRLSLALAQEKEHSEKARAGERAKSEFLAVMSHEVRTPLNGILGFSELLAHTPNLSPESRDYAQTITSSGEALLRILDDVLDFSRLEAGRLEIVPAPFNPRDILDDIRNLLGHQARRKGLEIIVSVAANTPPYLNGDAGRLRQILLNLVGNGVKFTEHGSVTISLRTTASGCEFSVSDTGPGLTSEVISRIFEPFTQADSSISRRHGGSGLGLSISRRLAELMGGTLDVRSHLGEGAEFRLVVPFKTGRFISTLQHPPAALDTDFARQHPLSILVVEDDAVNRKLIGALLHRLGYESRSARNGREAVVLQLADRADCILMDLQMPEMDGIEATEAIRAGEGEGDRPAFICALTANTVVADRERCFEKGMDDFLNKPVHLGVLAEVLARASDGKGSPR